MFLSKEKLEKLVSDKDIEITDFKPENLEDASYTFTLSKRLKLSVQEEQEIPDEGYELVPKAFALFYTQEKVSLKGNYICMLSARSSLAQMGLNILLGSFIAMPDTDNEFVIEVSNQGPAPVKLKKGDKIVKGVFAEVN